MAAQMTTTQRPMQRPDTQRSVRPPASWRRFATRPRAPYTGITMSGPWSSLRPYALKLLKHEHKVIRRMLKELDHSKNAGQRATRLARAEAEIVAYSRNVHEVFYPAFRGAAKKERQRKLYHELREHHREVELLLLDLQRCDPGSMKAAGCAKALRRTCNTLFHVESNHMFHHARRVLGRTNLKALGRQMQDHRRAFARNPNMAPMRSAKAAFT